MSLKVFLLELGNDFAFVARQKGFALALNDTSRLGLLPSSAPLSAHRRVEVGEFSHADAGQMNLYLDYAREHWVNPEENPPVGLILCSENDEAVAHYSLD